MDRIRKFFSEVKMELARMTWPSREELFTSTWIVIVFSLMLAVIIGAIDTLFSRMMHAILR